jgi:hypothetical protein
MMRQQKLQEDEPRIEPRQQYGEMTREQLREYLKANHWQLIAVFHRHGIVEEIPAGSIVPAADDFDENAGFAGYRPRGDMIMISPGDDKFYVNDLVYNIADRGMQTVKLWMLKTRVKAGENCDRFMLVGVDMDKGGRVQIEIVPEWIAISPRGDCDCDAVLRVYDYIKGVHPSARLRIGELEID